MADQRHTRRKRYVVIKADPFSTAVIGVYTTFKKALADSMLMGGYVEPLQRPEDGLAKYKREE